MTPRRIRVARALSAAPPVVLTYPRGALTIEAARHMQKVWRRVSRVPLVIVPDHVEVSRV